MLSAVKPSNSTESRLASFRAGKLDSSATPVEPGKDLVCRRTHSSFCHCIVESNTTMHPLSASFVRAALRAWLPNPVRSCVYLTALAVSLQLNAATGLDPSFGKGGIALTDVSSNGSPTEYHERINAVAIQPDGKTVVAGYSGPSVTNSDFSVIRFNADGSFDPTFGIRGKVLIDFGNTRDVATSIVIQPNGKIVVAGNSAVTTSYDFAFARLNSDGSLDTSFSGDGKVVIDIGSTFDQLHALALQSDGRILAAGSESGNNTDFAVIRLSANGNRDFSFGGGLVTVDFGTSQGRDEAFAIAVQSNGAIIVAGQSSNSFALARLNPSGSFDSSFSGDGKLTTRVGTYTNHARSLAIQSDGKIIAGGFSTSASMSFAMARFHPDGTLDTSFSGDGIVTDATVGTASSVMLGENGAITMAGGAFSAARYTSTGVLDTSFAGTGRTKFNFGYAANAQATGAAMRPDGSVVLAGYSVRKSNQQVASCVACLSGSGTSDGSFSQDGFEVFTISGPGETVWAGALQADGKIVVAGGGSNGVGTDVLVMRLHPDGTPDDQFGNNGVMLRPVAGGAATAYSTAIQADGRIIAAGRAANPTVTDFLLLRCLTDGSLDPTFGTGGIVLTRMSSTYDQIIAVSELANGRILACGSAGNQVALARYLPNGTLDTSFGSAGRVLRQVEIDYTRASGMRVLPNGRILVAGYGYISSSSTYVGFVLRFLENGSLDSTFGSAGIARQTIAGSSVMWNGVDVQSDGRIVLAGQTGALLNYDFLLCRLMPNGGLDTSFNQAGWLNIPFGTNDGAGSVVVAPNDKIVAAGWANTGGHSKVAAVRLMPDGRMDPSFSPGGKIAVNVGTGAAYANSLVLQGDRKPVLVGPAKGAFDSDVSVVRLEGGNPAISVEYSEGTRLAKFGSVPFGLASSGSGGAIRSLIVRNEGEEALTLGSMTHGGPHAPDFHLPTMNFPAILNPDATLPFDVRFVPRMTGNRSAAFAISSNDPGNPTFQLNLTGIGNMSPAFSGYTVSTPFEKPVTLSTTKLLAKASDIERDAMTAGFAVSSAKGGTIQPSGDGQWIYTPPAGFTGTDTLPITVADARGGSTAAFITASVGAAPDSGGPGVNRARITRAPDGSVEIVFHGIPGRQYPIQRSFNLTQWHTIAIVTADSVGVVRTLDESPGSDSAFYRLSLPQ